METPTRASINLKTGTIELEGSEAFVKEELENFSGLITNNYLSSKKNTANEVKLKENKKNSEINQSDEYLTHFGIRKDKLDEIIYTDDTGEFEIITPNIDGNKAEKQEKLTLLYCLTNSFYNNEPVDSSEIRDLCKKYGCLDPNNFSSYLKSRSNYFILDGEKRSHNKQISITIPGKKAAKELIKNIINEE